MNGEYMANLMLEALYMKAMVGRVMTLEELRASGHDDIYPHNWGGITAENKTNVLKEAIEKKCKLIDTEAYHQAMGWSQNEDTAEIDLTALKSAGEKINNK